MKTFNLNELSAECTLIDQEIRALDGLENTSSLIDGIINPELYVNAKYKILWVLKEPYDDFDEDGNPDGGGWDYRNDLNNNLINYIKIPTWRRIAYASYGILKEMAYDDMDDIKKGQIESDSIFEAIRSVAFINIKKTPGEKTSSDIVIKNAYLKYRTILLKQIEVYNPDIIIGGSTIPHFLNDFDLENSKQEGHGLKFYLKNKKVFIDAYHPSYPKGPEQEEEYVDEILAVAKDSMNEIA
jgi:hypothetical protein